MPPSASCASNAEIQRRHTAYCQAADSRDAAIDEQGAAPYTKPARPAWWPALLGSGVARRRRKRQAQASIRQHKLLRVVIMGAVIGSPLAMGFGVLVVERAEEAWVRSEAQNLVSSVRVREAEVTGVLDTLDRLQTSPCSKEDLAKLRTIILGSTIITDILRQENDRLVCSAVYGVTNIDIPALAKPGFRLNADQTIWRYVALPAVPNNRFIVVGHNDAFVVVRPSSTPPDLAPHQLGLSRFFINRATGQVSWFAGEPMDFATSLMTDGSSFWYKGSYAAIACSTDRMMCLVLRAPWSTMFLQDAAPFEIFGLAGGLAGSAASLSLLMWLHHRQSMPQRLRRALRADELLLHYQPIFDVRLQQVVGAEALIRWPSNNGAAVGPDEFIPVAEQSGMIGEITCFVIRRVGAELGPLLRERTQFRVSINIAADDFADARFHATLRQHIVEAGILPSQVALELTERRSAEVEAASTAITALRRAGYRIYIDDFGTGFSSLTYLSDLTIDVIKLDKSFTSQVGTGSARARLVQPILEMARDSGVTVIVEGVETSHQAAYFRARGVLRMQGFLFGRAVEAASLIRSVQTERVLM